MCVCWVAACSVLLRRLIPYCFIRLLPNCAFGVLMNCSIPVITTRFNIKVPGTHTHTKYNTPAFVCLPFDWSQCSLVDLLLTLSSICAVRLCLCVCDSKRFIIGCGTNELCVCASIEFGQNLYLRWGSDGAEIALLYTPNVRHESAPAAVAAAVAACRVHLSVTQCRAFTI